MRSINRYQINWDAVEHCSYYCCSHESDELLLIKFPHNSLKDWRVVPLNMSVWHRCSPTAVINYAFWHIHLLLRVWQFTQIRYSETFKMKKKNTHKHTQVQQHRLTDDWGNFYLSGTVGVSVLLREIGPTQLCSSQRAADGTRLTEEIRSSVRRNFLLLFLSLLLRHRDSQSIGYRFSRAREMRPNVSARARLPERTWSEVGNCSRARRWRAASVGRSRREACALTTDWGPARMSVCTVLKSATRAWSETATLLRASLF